MYVFLRFFLSNFLPGARLLDSDGNKDEKEIWKWQMAWIGRCRNLRKRLYEYRISLGLTPEESLHLHRIHAPWLGNRRVISLAWSCIGNMGIGTGDKENMGTGTGGRILRETYTGAKDGIPLDG